MLDRNDHTFVVKSSLGNPTLCALTRFISRVTFSWVYHGDARKKRRREKGWRGSPDSCLVSSAPPPPRNLRNNSAVAPFSLGLHLSQSGNTLASPTLPDEEPSQLGGRDVNSSPRVEDSHGVDAGLDTCSGGALASSEADCFSDEESTSERNYPGDLHFEPTAVGSK